MRGLGIRYTQGTDPDGSPAWLWSVTFFGKSLAAGHAVEKEDAEKAAAMALGQALAKNILTARDRDRAKMRLGSLIQRRPYLVLGLARLMMRSKEVERFQREAAQEELATYQETPKSLRLVPLPTNARALSPEQGLGRMMDLCLKAGFAEQNVEDGEFTVNKRFNAFMHKHFGYEAFGGTPSEDERNVKAALASLKKGDKKQGKKSKKAKKEDVYPEDSDEYGDEDYDG